MPKKRKKKKFKNFVKRNKTRIIIASIILLLILFFFGARIWLYVNLVIGNDVIVTLEADKEYISLKNGMEDTVIIEAKVTTNPFCSANCQYSFYDISKNMTLDKEDFILRPGFPMNKEMVVKAEDKGQGLHIFRVNMDCVSKSTFLCETNEEATSRNILLIVEHSLNDDEKMIEDRLKSELSNLSARIDSLNREIIFFNDSLSYLNNFFPYGELSESLSFVEGKFNHNKNSILELQFYWDKEDYPILESKYAILISSVKETEEQLGILAPDINTAISEHNKIISRINYNRDILSNFSLGYLQNEKTLQYIDDKISEANSLIEFIAKKNTLMQKKLALDSIEKASQEIINTTDRSAYEEAVSRSVNNDFNFDMLCMLNLTCISHPNISERASQEKFDLGIECDRTKTLFSTLLSLNQTLLENNVSLENHSISELREQAVDGYNQNISENASNYLYIMREISMIEEISYDDKPLLQNLIENMPLRCQSHDKSQIINFTFSPIFDSENITVLDIQFNDHSKTCCTFGVCKKCCTIEECNNQSYPVIFLHGYALSKERVADFSLDTFSKAQKKLEEDGFLNAGAITIYSGEDVFQGSLGMVELPMSFRVSYYFDAFKEPQKYRLIQGNSENIDTYAIRLKELIDNIKSRTAKQKVIVISHSMGGLVARRYMQIFGSNSVDSLIMIATPNRGIRGNVADYCPVLGGKLECRDMNENSLFMNKLNREKLPDIPVYNIIGTGCRMGNSTGDGIVLEENAKIEGADNYYIKGICAGTRLLHTDIAQIDRYPETYSIILKSLGILQGQ